MATVMDEPSVRTDAPTLQDLVDRLGGIPLFRILAEPAPGTATEEDLLRENARGRRLCELVDGVLVEKGMGFQESMLAGVIISLLRAFVVPRNLGLVAGSDGTLRLVLGLVRLPDVAFISWDRIPGGRVPKEPIPSLGPNLAVEVLSKSNTKAEMLRKRQEYFKAGAEAVWEVDPGKRTVAVYQAGAGRPTILDLTQTLEGTDSLAGFRLVLADLFAELDRSASGK